MIKAGERQGIILGLRGNRAERDHLSLKQITAESDLTVTLGGILF